MKRVRAVKPLRVGTTHSCSHSTENSNNDSEFDMFDFHCRLCRADGPKHLDTDLFAPFLSLTLPVFLGVFLSQFFTDPCASSPCLHGNCSRSEGAEEGEPAYTCDCSEGYEGERCDQLLLGLSPADWDSASPSAPEPATPVTSATASATQPPQPTTVASSTATTTTTTTSSPAPPTLQTWQPKPGQRLLVVPWEADRVRETHPHLSISLNLICGCQISLKSHQIYGEMIPNQKLESENGPTFPSLYISTTRQG